MYKNPGQLWQPAGKVFSFLFIVYTNYLFQFTIVNPFPYTFPIKNQCFLVLIEMYFLKYLISMFLWLLFKMFFCFLWCQDHIISRHICLLTFCTKIIFLNYIKWRWAILSRYRKSCNETSTRFLYRSEAVQAP